MVARTTNGDIQHLSQQRSLPLKVEEAEVGLTSERRSTARLSPKQYGFHKGRSTVHAIRNVTEIATKVKNRTWEAKEFCALITLDISNAYNTARWEKIMESVKKRHTTEYLLHIVDDYLGDRNKL